MEANKTSNYDFTIIVPIYNEEDNMPALEKALGEYLKKSLVKSCVLFVNDGSRDTSLDKIREICERNDDFYFISSAENHGLSTAMKAGFDVQEANSWDISTEICRQIPKISIYCCPMQKTLRW